MTFKRRHWRTSVNNYLNRTGEKLMVQKRAACLALVALLVGASASAGERPPSTAKPLSEIAAAVERAGFAPIVEAAFDDGRWEIEAYQSDTRYELRVDPTTGEIRSKRAED